MKKFISLTLSLIMIMTTLCALPFSAKAATAADLAYVSIKTNKAYFMAGDKLQLFISRYDKNGNKITNNDLYKIVNESWKVNGGATKYTNDTPWNASDPQLYIVNDNDFYYDYECYLSAEAKDSNGNYIDWPGYSNSSSQTNIINGVEYPHTNGTYFMYSDMGGSMHIVIRFYKTVVDGQTAFYPVGLPSSVTAPAKDGMKFVKWTGEYGPSSNRKALEFANATSATTTFTMPDVTEGVVTITPEYEKAETPTPATVVKKANTIKVKGKTITVKAKKLNKKNQAFAVKKAMTVSKAQGTVTYTLSTAKKGKKNFKSKFAVNKKNGKLTVKKGTKKGTYTLKIKVKAAGNKNYKAATKTVTVKVKVK